MCVCARAPSCSTLNRNKRKLELTMKMSKKKEREQSRKLKEREWWWTKTAKQNNSKKPQQIPSSAMHSLVMVCHGSFGRQKCIMMVKQIQRHNRCFRLLACIIKKNAPNIYSAHSFVYFIWRLGFMSLLFAAFFFRILSEKKVQAILLIYSVCCCSISNHFQVGSSSLMHMHRVNKMRKESRKKTTTTKNSNGMQMKHTT